MFDIGNRIKQLRKNNNMTMVDLATKADLSHSQISRLENNKCVAQIDTIEKICNVYNMTLNEFFNDNDKPIDINKLFEDIKDLPKEDIQALTEIAKRLKK